MVSRELGDVAELWHRETPAIVRIARCRNLRERHRPCHRPATPSRTAAAPAREAAAEPSGGRERCGRIPRRFPDPHGGRRQQCGREKTVNVRCLRQRGSWVGRGPAPCGPGKVVDSRSYGGKLGSGAGASVPDMGIDHRKLSRIVVSSLAVIKIDVAGDEGVGGQRRRWFDNADRGGGRVAGARLRTVRGGGGGRQHLRRARQHSAPSLAATFGAFVGGNITLLREIFYWIAQLLGSTVVCLLLRFSTGTFGLNGASVWEALVLEIVMTFGLVYTV